MSFDLTNKNISSTFQNLLQKTGSDNRLYDLKGNEVTDLRINGTLTADQYVVSSSVTNVTFLQQSGSSIFGDTQDDTHQFTGSINISGSLNGLLGDISVNHITASGNISSSGNVISDNLFTNHISASRIKTPVTFQIETDGVTMLSLTEGSQDSVKIGGTGLDVDFQVLTSGDDNTFFVNGGTNNIGIGKNDPDSKLN